MEDHRGRKGKLNEKKSERETNHERLWTLGNKLRASDGRGGDLDRLVMGIKEGMYCMVHWVLYASNESWNFTSRTSNVLGCLGG